MSATIERVEKELGLDVGAYICRECAERRGGVWPEGHVATMHREVCPYCGERRGLACIGDWDWPGVDYSALRD